MALLRKFQLFSFLSTLSMSLFAVSANAGLIGPTQINQGSNSNPNTEILAIESQTSLTDLIFGGKIEQFAGMDGAFGAGADVDGMTTVSWDLSGMDLGLFAIVVKSGRDFLNVYEVTEDMRVAGMGSVLAPNSIDSISHISFFVKAFTPPNTEVPEPAMGVLLALAGIGLFIRRRRVS